MEKSQVSRTATLAAIYRAYHNKNDQPLIFEDFLASRILPEGEMAGFEKQLVATMKVVNPKLASSFPDDRTLIAFMMQSMAATPGILARGHYTETMLEDMITGGVKQYVLLGAGLDTFAYRDPAMMEQLRVFEVDHPATQEYKRLRIAELGWDIPKNLHFVPLDFNREGLAALLKSPAYDRNAITLFSWMGVTYYLPRQAVDGTLKTVAEISAPGSRVVFDYLDLEAFDPGKVAPRVAIMLQLAQREKEPMQTGFSPATLKAEMAALGLKLEEDLGPADLQARYFADRQDRYYACEHMHFACAAVK